MLKRLRRGRVMKPTGNKVLPSGDIILKLTPAELSIIANTGKIMWTFINRLYRQYCLARIEEIRRLEVAG
jgi:hypothetical protein